MSRSARIALIILAILLLAAVGLGLWWWFARDGVGVVATDAQGNPLPSSGSGGNSVAGNSGAVATNTTPSAPKPVAVDPKVAEKLRAQQLAVSFVERYGSFSSQSNFANLEDLLIFMSQRLAAETQAQIQSGRAKKTTAPVPYFGIVTKALITTENAYDPDAGAASYTISAQRRRTEADGKTTATNQDATVTLVKEDGGWKVDRVEWR